MKADSQVIQEFNRLVNLDAAELERWLKTPESKNAGWTNGDSGETVGHDSGRKIVAILKANPDKDPNKYTKDQIQHMRKVAAYWCVGANCCSWLAAASLGPGSQLHAYTEIGGTEG